MAGDEKMSAAVILAWQPDQGTKVYIPAHRIVEVYKDRLQLRRRAWRPGAKIDSTAADPIAWDVDALYQNAHEEGPEVPDDAYPDYLNTVCAQLRAGQTGTLTLPTRAPQRAKVETYRRTEDSENRDAGALQITFQQDNEDDFTATSFDPPSASSSARATAAAAQDACESAGAWSSDIASFQELAAGLEDLANAPGEFADSLDAQANAVVHAAQRVEDAFTQQSAAAADEVSKMLTDPRESRAGLLNRRLADMAKRSTANTSGIGRVITVLYQREVSIFDIASELGQDSARLVAMNASLGDLLTIAPLTPIRVFAT